MCTQYRPKEYLYPLTLGSHSKRCGSDATVRVLVI